MLRFLPCLALLAVLLLCSIPAGADRESLSAVLRQGAVSTLQQPRFIDNGDGTVSDLRTGLIWLRHANCFGGVTWEEALQLAASLSHGARCDEQVLEDGSSLGEWRLPTIREIMTLPMIEFFNPALSNSMGTGKWTEGDPFLQVGSYYWSSSRMTDEDLAWYMYLYNGVLGMSELTQRYGVWPVKGRLQTLWDVEM